MYLSFCNSIHFTYYLDFFVCNPEWIIHAYLKTDCCGSAVLFMLPIHLLQKRIWGDPKVKTIVDPWTRQGLGGLTSTQSKSMCNFGLFKKLIAFYWLEALTGSISSQWIHIFYIISIIYCILTIKEARSESCSVVSDSLRPHGLYSLWNSPGQNTGVGSHSLLQGTFPAQGSNPGLPHCRQILYQLNHKRIPRKLEIHVN